MVSSRHISAAAKQPFPSFEDDLGVKMLQSTEVFQINQIIWKKFWSGERKVSKDDGFEEKFT